MMGTKATLTVVFTNDHLAENPPPAQDHVIVVRFNRPPDTFHHAAEDMNDARRDYEIVWVQGGGWENCAEAEAHMARALAASFGMILSRVYSRAVTYYPHPEPVECVG